MNEKKPDSCCAFLFLLIGLSIPVYLVYQAVLFFQRPDALRSILEFIEAVGVCAGAAVLVVAVVLLISWVSNRIKSRFSRLGKEVLVRCFAVDLEKPPEGSLPEYLPEAPGQRPAEPVYLLLSLSNYGLYLAAPRPNQAWPWIPADNDLRFSRLSGGSPAHIILSTFHLKINYIFYRQEGDLTVKFSPPGEFGYSGALPSPPGPDSLEIILVYTVFGFLENLAHFSTRGQPQKLSLVALDELGQDHPAATREVYQRVFQFVSAREAEEDDSWLYHSRPIYW